MTREEKIRQAKILYAKQLYQQKNSQPVEEEPSFLSKAGSFVKNVPSYLAMGVTQPAEQLTRLAATGGEALEKIFPVDPKIKARRDEERKLQKERAASVTLPFQDVPILSGKTGTSYGSPKEAAFGLGEAGLNVLSLATFGGSKAFLEGGKQLFKGSLKDQAGKQLLKEGTKNVAKGIGTDVGIAAGFGATSEGQREGSTFGSIVKSGLETAPAGLLPVGLVGGYKGSKALVGKAKTAYGNRAVKGMKKEIDDFLKPVSRSKAVEKLKVKGTDVKKYMADPDIYAGLKVENGFVNPDEAIAVLRKRIDPALDTSMKMVTESDRLLPKMKKETLAKETKAAIKQQGLSLADEAQLIKKAEEQLAPYADELSPTEIDDFRRRMRKSSSNAKSTLSERNHYDALQTASRKMLFDAMDTLSNTSGKKEFTALRQYIKEMIDVEDFLHKKIRNQKVKGGQLGKYVGRLTGAVVGSPGGFFGSMLGSEAGALVSDIIMNNQLGSAFKMKFIENITSDPAVLKEAQKMLSEMRVSQPLALPAPPVPTQGVREGSFTVNPSVTQLPAQAATTREAKEIAMFPAQQKIREIMDRVRKEPQTALPAPKVKTDVNTPIVPDVIIPPPPREFTRQGIEKATGVPMTLDATLPESLSMPKAGEKMPFDEVTKQRGQYRMTDPNVFKSLTETEGIILGEILTEFDVSQAGKRIFGEDGVSGIKSTFPQWVPEDLRSKKLFNEVTEILFGERQAKTKKQKEFLGIIYEEIQKRDPSTKRSPGPSLDEPPPF